jgi:hypothetical protein
MPDNQHCQPSPPQHCHPNPNTMGPAGPPGPPGPPGLQGPIGPQGPAGPSNGGCGSYFPSQPSPNQFNAIFSEIYSFIGAELLANHPPAGDMSNRVATTGWVESLISGQPMFPIVTEATGLNINVSGGVVSRPPSGSCDISPTTTPIAVVASALEYVWVRFQDCSIVVSTNPPSSDQGQLIARVWTNATNIIRIENVGSSTGWAQLESPFFIGDPRAPHPPQGDNDSSIATTYWVQREVERLNFAPTDSPLFTGNPTVPHPPAGDNDNSIPSTQWVQNELRPLAPINSPLFTGDPRVPSPPIGDNDTSIPNTSWVRNALNDYAPLNSPQFTGDPRGPNPPIGDNDTSLATTAWVQTELDEYAPINSPLFTGDPRVPTPALIDRDTSIPNTLWVGQVLEQYAPINSPLFTGDPRVPTPSLADNDLSIPNTAWVRSLLNSYAPLESPGFTGIPTVPDPPSGSDNNTIPNTRWVNDAFDERYQTWVAEPLAELAQALDDKAPINSPVFTGQPQAPTPPVNDKSQLMPNTQWVQETLYKMLFGPQAPVFTYSGGTINWTGGRAVISGPYHNIPGGSFTLPGNASGIFYAYIERTATSTGQVVIRPYDQPPPTNTHILFNTIHTSNGTVLGISTPPIGMFGY